VYKFFSPFFFLSSFGSMGAAAGRTGMRAPSEVWGHHGEQQQRNRHEHSDGQQQFQNSKTIVPAVEVVVTGPFIKNFPCNHIINIYKKILFPAKQKTA
jgi:hypothetical protein